MTMMTRKKPKTEPGTKLKKIVLGTVLALLLFLAILSFPEFYKSEKLKKINASLKDIKVNPDEPCKDIFSITQKSLFFLNKEWLPKNESTLNCFVNKNFYNGDKLNLEWNTNGLNFVYWVDLNSPEKCVTYLFFKNYPERKLAYSKNLTEQLRFLSKFIDLSYFCFDPTKAHFFSNDFDGSTELYNSDESLFLYRNRYHRVPENEIVSITRVFPYPQCANPIIPDVPVRDQSKNETCLKNDDSLKSMKFEYGRLVR